MIIDVLKAFVFGGLLCVFAQILLDKTKLTPAKILVGYVVAGVVLGMAGIYRPFAEFAGAGATTPLTGFGYAISKGIIEDIGEKGILGVLTGGLRASAAGIAAALIFGFFASVLSTGKPKS